MLFRSQIEIALNNPNRWKKWQILQKTLNCIAKMVRGHAIRIVININEVESGMVGRVKQ